MATNYEVVLTFREYFLFFIISLVCNNVRILKTYLSTLLVLLGVSEIPNNKRCRVYANITQKLAFPEQDGGFLRGGVKTSLINVPKGWQLCLQRVS